MKTIPIIKKAVQKNTSISNFYKIAILICITLMPIIINAQAFNNEYWVLRKGMFKSTNYFFKDGRYIHEEIYSGGQHLVSTTKGKYIYDSSKNEIHLTEDTGKERTLNISSITDSTIIIMSVDSPDNVKIDAIYKRRLGVANINWYFTDENQSHSFILDQFGYFGYSAGNKMYTGNYSLVDSVVYLEIKEKIIQKYELVLLPISADGIKVCLRINLDKKEINKSDLLGLLNDKFYNWELRDGKFYHDNFENTTDWIKFGELEARNDYNFF